MEKLLGREVQKLIGNERKEIDEMREKIVSFEKDRLDGGLASLVLAKTTFIKGTDSLLEKMDTVKANAEEITELGKLHKERIGLIIKIDNITLREIKKEEDLEKDPKFPDAVKILNDEIRVHEAIEKLAEELVSKKKEFYEVNLTRKGVQEFRKMLVTKKMD